MNRWLGALALAVCAYHLPDLLFGTVQFDALEVHYASQRYLSDELHAGRLPLWTPYLFTGFPFLADLQVGAWYPLNWPFFAVGVTPRSISGELLLHGLIACGGTFALAMRLIHRPAAAFAAAMFYGLSGWFAAHSQHVGMYATAAWLPWLVLVLHGITERLSLTRLTLAGVLGACIALPGHFQVALYTAAWVSAYGALEAIACRSWHLARRFALALGVTAFWGVLLSAVMILPGLELLSESVRSQLATRGLADLGYFHPASLITLVDADYYRLLSGHYVGPGDSTQHYFYAGIALVPLALLGLHDVRVARTAAFLGLPFLWYALGPAGGLFRLVSRLPGFSSVELPMHGWFLPALGLALLGAAGLAWIERRVPGVATRGLLALMFIDVLVVNQLLNPLAYARGGFEQLYGNLLSSFQWRLSGASPPVERLYAPPLAAVGYRNHALQSRVETTYGYNPLELAAFADYADAAESNPLLVKGFAATHTLLDAGQLLPRPDSLPLAYFAQRVVSVPDAASARAALLELDPSEATVVVGAPPPVVSDAAASLSVVARGLDELTLHYASTTSNLLRVAIPAYPGWAATLGDTELPLMTVDHAWIGVVVPPGEGELRLRYTPRVFLLGAALSALASVVTLLALIAQGQAKLHEALQHRVDA